MLVARGDDSPLLDFPDIGYASYLLDILFDIGMCGSSGFGPETISWSEVNSWMNATGTKLSKFELTTIRALSRAFVDQYSLSNEALIPSPYAPEEIDAAVVSKRVGDALRMLASRKKESKRPLAKKGQK